MELHGEKIRFSCGSSIQGTERYCGAGISPAKTPPILTAGKKEFIDAHYRRL